MSRQSQNLSLEMTVYVPPEVKDVPLVWNRDAVMEAMMLNIRLVQRIVGRVRPTSYGSGMPDVLRSFEDLVGMVETGVSPREAERNMAASTKQVTAAERIIRWQVEYLSDAPEGVRRVLKVWLRCKATRASFSAEFRRRGWTRMTTYRRLDQAFDLIAAGLNRDNVPTTLLGDLL